jgi:outer membrane protein OmpA-like peptidoglycan-associated protein
MKYLISSLIVISLLIPSLVKAQTEVTIRKKDFKNDRTGFESAWQNVTNGNLYYKDKGVWYGNAYDEYLKAILYNAVNPELNYKIGVAALFSDHKEEAVRYFQKVLEEKPDLTIDILFLTGMALQYAGKYPEAIDKLNLYLNTSGKKSEENIAKANKCIEECNSAILITKDTLRIKIITVGSGINSNADDYSEFLSADGKTMFFASRRELSKKSTYYKDTKYDENIFFSTINNGEWSIASTAGKALATSLCETPLFLNSTGEELYVYTGYQNGGDIKVSIKKNGKWKTPSNVTFRINSNRSETSMTFTPDGKEVWFVSDRRKDGLGGKDIYMIKKMGERKWSKPVNAGPSINTRYDEESVRFSDLGDTLWFSSKGHNTIGGFDIFYSRKDSNGIWSQAVNYGYPVNTPWDELFYFPERGNDSSFYFTSNNSESIGGLDIFQGRILPPEKVILPPPPPRRETLVIRDTVVVIREVIQAPPPPVPVVQPEPQPVAVPETPKELVLYLIGKIKDSETGDPVLSKIDIVDPETNLVVATTASSDIDGTYRVRLPAKKSYMADLRATGFLADMKRINIPGTYKEEVYNLDVSLIRIKVGKKVVLNNILFETGKSVLTASSYTELGRLMNIMQDDPKMKIEISGHTDNTGSQPLNFKLSEARAKAVVDFLIQKGIDATRMEFKGFGSLQPIADNATAAGRTKNRRVEFKILEF